MVTSVTSLTRNGLRDWLLQRLSSLYMAVYIIALVAYLIINQATDFYVWHSLFSMNAVRLATVIFLFFLIIHAWIGLWTIATDYLKRAAVRLSFLTIVMLILFASFLWGIQILWSL